MRVKRDFGFQNEYCERCLNSEDEQDELVSGRPPCKVNGYCKHLGNAKQDELIGLSGCPLDWLRQGGLEQFEIISERIISLSAWDGVPLPTVSFYPCACGVVDMDEELFQELLDIKLHAIRMETLQERARAQKRLSHGIG